MDIRTSPALVCSVKEDTGLDGQMLGKSDMQSYCTSTTNSQHSTQVAETFSSEQVSLAEFLDDQSDDGYATSPAASSPGSMWSASNSPSTIDEDTISSIASLWDDMSNDSLFRSSGKRRADHSSMEETPAKFMKVIESGSSFEGPQSGQVLRGHGDFSSALKHSQLLLHLAGTPADDHLITVPEASKCAEQSKVKSVKTTGCRKLTRVKPRKSVGLSVPCPSSQDGIELKIVDQPERHHRARYLVEGSRGCVKNEAKVGYPTVQLRGWGKSAELQVFIVTDQGKVRPHGYYQACKVTGQNATPCSEADLEGSKVIKIPWEPSELGGDMEMRVDCVGILKLRNADVEHNGGLYRSKKKSTSVRMAFRVHLVGSPNVTTLQTVSSPICCTQPLGHPEIIKKSLTECSVTGGQELFIIGKNFISKNCEVKVMELSGAGKPVWTGTCQIDKSLFHNTHILCTMPPYKKQDLKRPVEVYLVVSCGGGKSSELMAHPITYTPIPEVKPNVAPVQEPVPDLSNAAVLQLLASRLACTKDTTPILKLSDQIPLVSMGQPLDLKKNPTDLFNQQTQVLQHQLQQQAKKQTFEDVMKVAAGLMTKNDIPQEVEPVQVVSSATDLNTSAPSVALLSSLPVNQPQSQGLADLLLASSAPSSVLSTGPGSSSNLFPGSINLLEPILFSSTNADISRLPVSSVLNTGLTESPGSTSNLTLSNTALIKDVNLTNNTTGHLSGVAVEDVLELLKALQRSQLPILS